MGRVQLQLGILGTNTAFACKTKKNRVDMAFKH